MPKRPPQITATNFKDLVFQINEALAEHSDYIEEIYGVDEKQFISHNDIDLNGKRLTNIGSPVDLTDVARKADLENASWPIGSVFFSVVATNPGTLLGFGTWTQIAQGQFIVGQKASDSDFTPAEKTGGAKTHVHSVDPPATTSSGPSAATDLLGSGVAGAPTGTHTHSVDIAAFNSAAGSSLPPYCVLYAWKRTA